jgi:hypothetical protein
MKLDELIGFRIAGAHREDGYTVLTLVRGRKRLDALVMSDAEGNGPGALHAGTVDGPIVPLQ